MAFSLAHDENLIEKTNVSLIINFSYMDMKSACHTESGLNADTLIGLKMQSMVKFIIYLVFWIVSSNVW